MGDSTKAVATQLAQQHAIHGLFGEVFEDMGGKEFLRDWAEENPGRFITLLTKMTPNMTPINTIQGDVNLVVHNTLGPTALDGDVTDSVVDEQ